MHTRDPIECVRPELLVAVPRQAAKAKRVPHEDFTVPGLGDAAWIPANNYNVAQLRATCVFHGLRRTGNKPESSKAKYYVKRLCAAQFVKRLRVAQFVYLFAKYSN